MDKRHARAIIAFVWLAVLVGGFAWGLMRGLTIEQVLRSFHGYVTANVYAPVLFVLFYGLVRPLIFLPASWLCIVAGSVFGFWWGSVYSLLGENISASAAYVIGRYFRRRPDAGQTGATISKWRRLLDRQTFPTILAMHAAYFPFDPMNYASGLLRVPWRPFFWGTLIGCTPVALTFVSFGAALDFTSFVTHLDEFDAMALLDGTQVAISLALLMVSAIIAWIAYRYQRTAQR